MKAPLSRKVRGFIAYMGLACWPIDWHVSGCSVYGTGFLYMIACWPIMVTQRAISMNPHSTLRQLSNLLHSKLDELSRLLIEANPTAVAAAIPGVAPGDENKPVEQITVVPVFDKEATALAIKCYKDLYIGEHTSKKSVRRTVGAVWIDNSVFFTAIEAVVREINEIKMAIKSLVVDSGLSRHNRFKLLREIMPGIFTMHLYRQIHLFSGVDVSLVAFSWQQKDSIYAIEKDSLIEQIQTVINETTAEDYIEALKSLQAAVISVPEGKLRIRRSIKVQPGVNLKIGNSYKTVPGPMPVIILQEAPLDIRKIRSFDAKEYAERKTRSDIAKHVVVGTFQGITIVANE